MSQCCIVAVFFLAAGVATSDAGDRALSAIDIAKIKRICAQAIGHPVAKEHDLWSQLTPFLRSKSELDHLTVDCSSQHCSGSIRLRDDAEVLYTSIHVPPEHSKIGPGDLTPDIEYKGNNRFVGAAFIRHGHVVFRKGALPEWFIDLPKRYKTSNQSMKPTAPSQDEFSELATTPSCGLSLSC
jgi:hypothetical protein